jgi:hypothetical protein
VFLTVVPDDDQSPEAEAARFLARARIPDLPLARALDRLARDLDDKRHDLAPIDYKSLGVRQLGSMYEGLLEFRLRLAPERMAIVKGKRTEEIVPYREAQQQGRTILRAGRGRDAAERTLDDGTVYLENDRRERRATGSYYTPDHVVEYIVAQAVGPTLQEHLERLRPKLRQAQQAYRDAQHRQAAFQKKGMAGDDPEKLANDPRWQALVEELFEFRVLDPAMGSGHFLVEAVDLITDRMLRFLHGFPWNPVQASLRRTRETILADLDRQGVSVDPGRLTDVNLLKRHVLKRCVFGVDLNPMAVELAKVSLWLDCFTIGAPLSFLDHHLKLGNSLLGVSVDQARDALEGKVAVAEQPSLFSSSRFAGLLSATTLMRRIGSMPDVTGEQVRLSRSEYARASDELAPFKRILDVYLSRWFGNPPRKGTGKNAAMVDPALDFLRSPAGAVWVHEAGPEVPAAEPALLHEHTSVAETALAAAVDKRFFHWELEFPEVFYGPRPGTTQVIERKSDGGFDALIGNPPWVRQETLGESKPVLQALYPDIYDSIADTYVYFLGRGLGLLRRNRHLALLVPNKWLRAAYGQPLRTWLHDLNHPLELVDFGHAPLFPDADTFPCVLVVAAGASGDHGELRACPVPRAALDGLPLGDFVEQHGYGVPLLALRDDGWTLERPDQAALLEKIRGDHPTLGELLPNSIYYGIKTGLTEAFFVDRATRDRLTAEDPDCAPLLRQALRGRNVERWHPNWDGEWLILLKSSENHPWPWANAGQEAEQVFDRVYPSLYRYLKPLQAALEARQDKGRYWWELRSCSYYGKFDEPRIPYQDICYHSYFSLDGSALIHNDLLYSLCTDQKYVLAILASSAMWWLMFRVIPHRKDEALAMKSFAVEQLPIAKPSAPKREQLENAARRLVELAAQRQQQEQAFRDRLTADLGVERRPRALETFWRLGPDALRAELRRAAPHPFGPRAEATLLNDYKPLLERARQVFSASLPLEVELQHLVFDLYGLTPPEVALLRATAPPRDPLALVEEEARLLGVPLALPA